MRRIDVGNDIQAEAQVQALTKRDQAVEAAVVEWAYSNPSRLNSRLPIPFGNGESAITTQIRNRAELLTRS